LLQLLRGYYNKVKKDCQLLSWAIMQSGSCRFFHEEIEWADAIGLRFDLCFGSLGSQLPLG